MSLGHKLINPSIALFCVVLSPSLTGAVCGEQPLTFRLGPLISAKDEFAFQIENQAGREVITSELGVNYSAFAVEDPDKPLEDSVTIADSRDPTFPTIAPGASELWTSRADNILASPRFLKRGIYRIRWKWEEPWQHAAVPASRLPERLKFLSEPISVLVEPATLVPDPSPAAQLYEKPIDRPGDPDIEPTPVSTPAPRLNTRAPLEMASVLSAAHCTIAFIFTNEGAASTGASPLGRVGNGFTIVTPTNGIVRQGLKAAAPTQLAPKAQKVWKADMAAFFKGRKLQAPGWYQLFWKVGERKAGPLWLYKAPLETKSSAR